jgi:hypothetical protein
MPSSLFLEPSNRPLDRLAGRRGGKLRSLEIAGASPDAAHKLGAAGFDAAENVHV